MPSLPGTLRNALGFLVIGWTKIGLCRRFFPQAQASSHPTPKPPPLTIATLLVALASALKLLSPDKRAAVAAQLHALALHPEEAAMREALEKLMESDGAPIPRSAVSTRDFAAPHQSAPQPQEVPAFLKK